MLFTFTFIGVCVYCLGMHNRKQCGICVVMRVVECFIHAEWHLGVSSREDCHGHLDVQARAVGAEHACVMEHVTAERERLVF